MHPGARAEVNFMPLLTRRLALLGSTLRGRSVAEKAAIADALRKEVWPLVAATVRLTVVPTRALMTSDGCEIITGDSARFLLFHASASGSFEGMSSH